MKASIQTAPGDLPYSCAATLNNPIGAYVKFLADRGIVGSEFSGGLPVLRIQAFCCSQTRDE